MTSAPYPEVTNELLSAYIDEAVSEDERRLIEQAVAENPDVAWRLESLRATVRLLRELPALTLPRSFVLTPEQVGQAASGGISVQGKTAETTAGAAPRKRAGDSAASGGFWRDLWRGWDRFWQGGSPALRNAMGVSFAVLLALLVTPRFVANTSLVSFGNMQTAGAEPPTQAMAQREAESAATPAIAVATTSRTPGDTQASGSEETAADTAADTLVVAGSVTDQQAEAPVAVPTAAASEETAEQSAPASAEPGAGAADIAVVPAAEATSAKAPVAAQAEMAPDAAAGDVAAQAGAANALPAVAPPAPGPAIAAPAGGFALDEARSQAGGMAPAGAARDSGATAAGAMPAPPGSVPAAGAQLTVAPAAEKAAASQSASEPTTASLADADTQESPVTAAATGAVEPAAEVAAEPNTEPNTEAAQEAPTESTTVTATAAAVGGVSANAQPASGATQNTPRDIPPGEQATNEREAQPGPAAAPVAQGGLPASIIVPVQAAAVLAALATLIFGILWWRSRPSEPHS